MEFTKDKGTKAKWLIILTITSLTLSTCDQQQKERTKRRVADLKDYVQRHRDSIDIYANRKWDSLDHEFVLKENELVEDTVRMDDDIRQSYYNTLNDWQSLKAEYARKSVEQQKINQMDDLRKSLTMDGVRTDYTDLTAANILQEYEYFVNTVRTNKDTYTKEQWTVINVNYKALNGRNREVQKDIPSGDASKIVKLQLEYNGIKALNRPFADNP
ncbi:MAG: hypothetical protein JWO06_3232 [Bacteroidota bacterium]|nr:hypothetical protein [Bacteroidota bacterium]